jgi:hypothetical protein
MPEELQEAGAAGYALVRDDGGQDGVPQLP